jgi:hypothetical protein
MIVQQQLCRVCLIWEGNECAEALLQEKFSGISLHVMLLAAGDEHLNAWIMLI